ncbi:MAG: DUF2219 family protein [Vicingaceae bacterium]
MIRLKLTKQLVVFHAFQLLCLLSNAQSKDSLLNSQDDYYQWASFAHSNDLFSVFEITDRYFSFAHQLDYLRKIKSPKRREKTTYYNIALNFHGYTPEHELDEIDTSTTRPFVAWSYIAFGFINTREKSYLKYQLEVGYIGEKARGEEIQNWVHENISDDPEVMGWENQINNQLGINLSMDYRATLLNRGKHILLAGSEQKLGNVFTHLWPSIRYQFNGRAISGYLPFQYSASRASNISIEANIGFRYEFFNITIEGTPSTDVFNALEDDVIFRGLITAGLGLRYQLRNFSIHLSNNYNSKRVQSNQDHIYGVLGFAYGW